MQSPFPYAAITLVVSATTVVFVAAREKHLRFHSSGVSVIIIVSFFLSFFLFFLNR